MDVSCFLRESDFLFFCYVSFATLFLPLSKSIRRKLNTKDLLQKYLSARAVKKLTELLTTRSDRKYRLVNNAGSVTSLIVGAMRITRPGLRVVVLNDREEAAYFYNDILALADEKQIAFLPSSYRRMIKEEEKDNDSVLVRTEVLNNIRNGEVDTLITYPEALAEKTAEKTGALVYPSIHFGYSWSWRDRIGTVTIRQDILREILKDVVRSVERYGVKILIFMNGHEANRSVIKYAIREIQDETDVKVLGMFYPGMEEIYDKYMETPTWGGMFHACEFETSLMLAVKPETVHMERAVQEYPVRPTTYGMDNTSIGELSVSGTYGNPVPATEEKGEMMLEQFTENISAVIEECVKKLVREET